MNRSLPSRIPRHCPVDASSVLADIQNCLQGVPWGQPMDLNFKLVESVGNFPQIRSTWSLSQSAALCPWEVDEFCVRI